MLCDVNCDSLVEEAKAFFKSNWQGEHSQVVVNTYLTTNASCVRKFAAGMKEAGGANAPHIFGWHGTKTTEGVISICRDGWDPTMRRAPNGEYFAVQNSTSKGYAGQTNMMIVACILEGRWLDKQSHYVVSNPRDRDVAYQLPVLVVSYNNGVLPSFPPLT